MKVSKNFKVHGNKGQTRPTLRLNLVGQIFGRLEVVEFFNINKHGQTQWKCRCSCGKIVIKTGSVLMKGVSKSCGCLRSEVTSIRTTTHGNTSSDNGKPSPELKTWYSIRSRCYWTSNPDYKFYGGRGIGMSKEWYDSFTQFLKDMGTRPGKNFSLDRINNEGNYEAGNCKWATRKEQANNTRRNRMIEYNNEVKPITYWIETLGLSRSVVYRRLKKGMSLDLVFTKGVLK